MLKKRPLEIKLPLPMKNKQYVYFFLLPNMNHFSILCRTAFEIDCNSTKKVCKKCIFVAFYIILAVLLKYNVPFLGIETNTFCMLQEMQFDCLGLAL